MIGSVTMADGVVRLTFPAKTDYLLLARLALAGLSRSLPLDEEALADLKLAVTEACGNAVRHAYGAGHGQVSVAYVVLDHRLEMIVEDQGAGLTRLERELEFDELAESGMGIAIIRAVVDELDVREGADGRGTCVHMTKRFPVAVAEIG
jgi:serine/threonine-protein kinase RsbW